MPKRLGSVRIERLQPIRIGAWPRQREVAAAADKQALVQELILGASRQRGVLSCKPMLVHFRKTGARRYAVLAERELAPAVVAHPAPGYDEYLPHDLLHFVAEAE